jgi:predicted PP-loop superfamily ATPase
MFAQRFVFARSVAKLKRASVQRVLNSLNSGAIELARSLLKPTRRRRLW